MSEENKDVVRTYMRAWEAGDLGLLESVVASDFSHTMLGQVEDRATLLQQVAGMHEVYSDVEYRIHELVAEGDRVACYWTSTMRHTDPLPLGLLSAAVGKDTLEPSQRTIEMSGLFIAVIRDGRLVGGWGEYDRLGMAYRLGALDANM